MMASEQTKAMAVLCRRLHQHGFVKKQPGDLGCDGKIVVCGFCEHTARQMLDAARATQETTPEPTLADLAARVAELRKAFDPHFHHPDTGECYWHNPPVTGQAKVDLSAPDFTTSDTPSTATEEALAEIAAGRVTRHETFADLMADLNGPDDPAPGVMTDDEIIRAGYVQGDVNASMANAIRLTRASIRAQLAANEAGAVKEGVGLIEYSLTALEDAIAAALKAHKEGV